MAAVESRDIPFLKPGATYTVQAVPKNNSGENPQPPSFITSFTVPAVLQSASNTTVQIFYPPTGSGVIVTGIGSPQAASSTMYINGSGLQAFNASGTRTVYIDSNSGNAYFAGSVVATSGSIGGFQITSGSLIGGTGSNTVGLSGSSQYAFWAGNSNPALAPFWVKNDGTANVGSVTVTSVTGGSGASVAGVYPANPNGRAIFAGATDSVGTSASFYVTNSGSVYANAASFNGPIIAGTVTASTATISLGNTGSVVGGAIYVPNASSPTFKVDSAGNMTATSASITGQITASAGTVGGFSISSSSLTASAGTVGLSTTSVAFWAGGNGNAAPLYITNTGILYATGAQISGSVNAASGTIGGFTIGANTLSAPNIVISSSSGLNLGNGQFTVNQTGAMVAQTASITGNVVASSGSITGTLSIGSNGQIVAGQPQVNSVIMSSSGLTGTSQGLAVFNIPTDGTPPTLGGFQVVKSGLTAVGSASISASGTSGAFSITIPPTSASLIWPGVSASGTNIGTGAIVLTTSSVTGLVTLSASNTATFSGSTVIFTPQANLVVGQSTSNNITIRSASTSAGVILPPAIFTVISGSGTASGQGDGFYLDQLGNFRLASGSNALTVSAGNLSLTGAVNATSGSFAGTVNASAGSFTGAVVANSGSIAGFAITSGSLIGGSGSTTVGMSGSTTYSFWSGSAAASVAPFSVTNTGLLVANSATIKGTINGLTIGFGGGSGSTNTALGLTALALNTSGSNNLAVGSSALYNNTSGNNNTAIGYQALATSSGNNNIAVGFNALRNNTTASGNIAMGVNALFTNTQATDSIAIGSSALYSSNNAASGNIGLGYAALAGNVNGVGNIAIGQGAYSSGSTGSQNIAIGASSLYAATSSAANLTSDNIGIGTFALYSASNAYQNTGVGSQAITWLTTGLRNTAVGYNALIGGGVVQFFSGTDNTGVGYNTGATLISGNNNLFLGRNTDVSASGISGAVAIGTDASGNGARATASNQIVIGTSNHTTLHPGQVQIGAASPLYFTNGTSGVTGTASIGMAEFAGSALYFTTASSGGIAGSIIDQNWTVTAGSATTGPTLGKTTAAVTITPTNYATNGSGTGATFQVIYYNPNYPAAGGTSQFAQVNLVKPGSGYAAGNTVTMFATGMSGSVTITLGSVGAFSTTPSRKRVALIDYGGGTQQQAGWVPYTPVWASTGTAPVIGNGSITGAYQLIDGNTVHFWALISFGTTTTFGTGAYTLSVPLTSIAGPRFGFEGWLINTSIVYSIKGHLNNTVNAQLYYINNGTTSQVTNVSPTAPVALAAAAGNSIQINGTYTIA